MSVDFGMFAYLVFIIFAWMACGCIKHEGSYLIGHWVSSPLTNYFHCMPGFAYKLSATKIEQSHWPAVIGWQKPNKFMVHVSMSPPDYSLHFYSIYVSSSFILSLFRNPWIKSNLKKVIICKWMKERTLFDSWSTEVDNKDKQSKPTY